MKVLVVGGTGYLGGRIVQACLQADHEVAVSTRQRERPEGLPGPVRAITWNTQDPFPSDEAFDAVVMESGASLIGKRWTASYKREIEASRVTTNRRLAEWMRDHRAPPSVFVTACGVGYYGMSPDGPVDETSPPGDDFLARLCRDWENAALAAEGGPTRVVSLRQGIVLTPEHGALGIMLPFFKAGMGGPVGDGRQPFPWITPDDFTAFAMRALTDTSVRGPYNVVAPDRVTNRAFTETLGEALHRPTLIPVPPFALRALWGEGADIVVSGQDAVPARMEEMGFQWRYPALRQALAALVERHD